MEKSTKSKRKNIIIFISVFLVFVLLSFPLSTVIVYEAIFGVRYETKDYLMLNASDYDGLKVERSDFESCGVALAGYKYSKESQDVKGVVVVAHGLGGGGHNGYLPIIDKLTSNGYYVFTYDGMGNDNSAGDSVEGLPQGVISLDSALCHAYTVQEYSNLPFALFGHSWGGYSVGNVLNLHPEIKAAVIVAGFNESEDMLLYQSEKTTGMSTAFLLPFLKLYERLKFGSRIADISALDGFGKSDAGIMVLHSIDDETVPTAYGYDKFYASYAGDPRFEMILYSDRGHNGICYSEAAREYRTYLDGEYEIYLKNSGAADSESIMAEFMRENLVKDKYFEVDDAVISQIVAMLDRYCATGR